MFFGVILLSSEGCKPEAIKTYFGSVFHPKGNFEIVQSECCKILLVHFDFTASDVELLLQNFNNTSSTGPDTILFLYLRHALSFQHQLYTHFFNKSKKRNLAFRMEELFLTALLRLDKPNHVENYRLIVILCKLFLLFEHLLLDFSYLIVKSQVSLRQHGIMKHRTTASQL